MVDILELQTFLNDTGAAVARLEQHLVQRPQDQIASLNLNSLRKRLLRFEEEFLNQATKKGMDVCSYRLFKTADLPNILGISNALADFQKFFSLVYDALKNGSKSTAYLNPESAARTAFGFGYTYSGSVGIVLTMRNQVSLFGAEMDETVSRIFEMAQSTTSAEIAAHARVLGAAPIRAMYSWADHQVDQELGADIEWRRSSEFNARLLMQYSQLVKLRSAIAETSAERTEEKTYHGILVGGDIKSRKFHFQPDNEKDFSGKVSPEFKSPMLGGRYVAQVTKTIITTYSTEQEIANYFLHGLTPE